MATKLDTVLNLSRARSLLVRDVDDALGAHHGLGLNDLAALLELKSATQHRLRRADLARRLAVTPSGVARQLAPLERMGVVGRESNPTDARLALVVLTETGERIAAEALGTARQAAGRALGRLWSPAEQERLGVLLDRAGPHGGAD